MQGEKILITGGAGFIGSHLCKKLLSKENKIFCLDNFYTGSRQNIKPFLNNPNFQLLEKDIIEIFEIEADYIFNLACPASPPHYQKDSIKTMKTSILGIYNLLDIVEKNNARLLQASTSEIYGYPLENPQKESYWGNVNPIGVRSCYDEGKRCAETILVDFYRQKKSDIKIVRIFNTYGPNMAINDGRVISNFIVQALKNENITVYGDGRQTRSFCYIDDLVEGLIKMMESNNFIGPVNIGNPNEMTVLELAELIISLTNSKSKIVHQELPQDDPTNRKPDISLAKLKLKWEPKVDIIEGLEKTIRYFKELTL